MIAEGLWASCLTGSWDCHRCFAGACRHLTPLIPSRRLLTACLTWQAVLEDPAFRDHINRVFRARGADAPGPGELTCRTT